MKTLGAGAFGTVWLAECLVHGPRFGSKVAVKVINKARFLKSGGNPKQLMAEVHLLDKLRHPNIIEIVDSVARCVPASVLHALQP